MVDDDLFERTHLSSGVSGPDTSTESPLLQLRHADRESFYHKYCTTMTQIQKRTKRGNQCGAALNNAHHKDIDELARTTTTGHLHVSIY